MQPQWSCQMCCSCPSLQFCWLELSKFQASSCAVSWLSKYSSFKCCRSKSLFQLGKLKSSCLGQTLCFPCHCLCWCWRWWPAWCWEILSIRSWLKWARNPEFSELREHGTAQMRKGLQMVLGSSLTPSNAQGWSQHSHVVLYLVLGASLFFHKFF